MFDDLLDDIFSEVEKAVTEAGEKAVECNIQNGDYRNITGRLRRSNYYEIEHIGNIPTKLVIGNRAEYASAVESRGRMVITDGALLAHKLLNG